MTSINIKSELSFELESLSLAVNYQKLVYETIEPYLGNSIIEVGAGIGNISQLKVLKE